MRFAVTTAAAALAGAALIPHAPLGIGVTITALLAAAAVAKRPGAHTALFGSAAVLLACAPALRDAGWIVAVDLSASVLFASVALAGGETFARLVAGALAFAVRLGDAPSVFRETELPGARPAASAVRGALLGGVLVLPFGVLFWTADRAFAQLGSSVPFPAISGLPLRLAVLALVVVLCTGLALAARRPLRLEAPVPARSLAVVDWAIPLALLDLLFLAFVLVQLTVLFGGRDHVLRTAGLTYAEYARHGFAQLLGAAALTIAVVAASAHLVRPRGRERLLLRALLGALCALTLVVLASALKRLELYEDAYGFTRLRLAAHAFGLWLGGLFVLVLLLRRRLPQLCAAVTAAGLVAFTLADPDRLVAERNVQRWRDTGRIDVGYLASLSADAVPELVQLPVGLRDRALTVQRRRLAHTEPWSSANLARARARAALDRAGASVR